MCEWTVEWTTVDGLHKSVRVRGDLENVFRWCTSHIPDSILGDEFRIDPANDEARRQHSMKARR